MASRYVVWSARGTENSCVLGPLSGVKSLPLKRGRPHASIWPDDVTLRMDPEFPDDMGLLDNIPNLESLIVASAPLKRFIEKRHPPKVEYLPVKIVNHKGRVEKAPYFVVHPVDPHDALDLARSGAELMGKTVMNVSHLVVNEDEIPSEAVLVRLAGVLDITLVARELADSIAAEGFTGVAWLEYEQYGK